MLKAVAEAKAAMADIVVFGELATCGYPPRDFLEFEDFIKQSDATIERLAQEATGILLS